MSISLTDFANSRALEIRQLLKDIQKPNSNNQDFQCMPIHLRRRSSSRKFTTLKNRKIHKISKRKFSKKRNKNLSRKKKRQIKSSKNFNLDRLPTHIWHAKRFHMINMYNFNFPFCSTTKLFRPTHRAIKKTICLQDISFINPILIKGAKIEILNFLSKFIKISNYIENFEYPTLFYKDSSDYHTMLGPILLSYFSTDNLSTFFIYTHNLLLNPIYQEFKSHNIAFNIEINYNLARFRLIGPLSLNLLLIIMNQKYFTEKITSNVFNPLMIKNNSVHGHFIDLSLLKQHYGSVYKDVNNKQPAFLNNEEIQSVFQKPNLMIESLVAIKIEQNSAKDDNTSVQSDVKFDDKINMNIDEIINFPVLIITRNNFDGRIGCTDYGNGFDIILPRIYSRKVFNFLVLHGAKVGGFREYNYMALETFKRKFPEDFPDVFVLKDKTATYQNISSRKIIKRIKELSLYNTSINECFKKYFGENFQNFRILSEIEPNVNYDSFNFVFIGIIALTKGTPKRLKPIYIQTQEDSIKYKLIGIVIDGDMSLSIGRGVGKGVIQLNEWKNIQLNIGKKHAFIKNNDLYYKCEIFLSSSLYL